MTGVVQRFIAQDLRFTYRQFGDSRGVLMGHRTTHPMARSVARRRRESCPKTEARSADGRVPDRGVDTTSERSERVVEAAGVEPASERPVTAGIYMRSRA